MYTLDTSERNPLRFTGLTTGLYPGPHPRYTQDTTTLHSRITLLDGITAHLYHC